MPRLPQLSAIELVKLLRKIDPLIEIRQGRGSHVFQLRRDIDGVAKLSTVAAHANKPLKIGTLKGILKDLEIDEGLIRI